MPRRWRVLLPVIGLSLFADLSYHSVINNREAHRTPSRYFWWTSIRLDSDPLNPQPWGPVPCENAQPNCQSWDHLWVEPGLAAEFLMLSAFPAFLVGKVAVHTLGRFGLSQVPTFFLLMPPLLLAWYYFLGWLLDRRRLALRAGARLLNCRNFCI